MPESYSKVVPVVQVQQDQQSHDSNYFLNIPSPTMTTTFSGVKLKEAEAIFRPASKLVANVTKQRISLGLKLRGTIIPKILLPTIIFTGWGALWVWLTKTYSWLDKVVVAPVLITILALTIGLLLVFRTNTAYDRYWQGRTLFCTMTTNVRNLSRSIWTIVTYPKNGSTAVDSGTFQSRKEGAMHLLAAYPASAKHYFRCENGILYKDVYPLLCHLPNFEEERDDLLDFPLPIEISFHLSEYFQWLKVNGFIETAHVILFTNMLNTLVDTISNLDRIRNSPIPLAYTLHTRQCIFLYLLSLPFQMITALGWGTIFAMLIASFTIYGIEAIGTEISNPLGYDANDLPVHEFCQELSDEIFHLMNQSGRRDEWKRVTTRLELKRSPSMKLAELSDSDPSKLGVTASPNRASMKP